MTKKKKRKGLKISRWKKISTKSKNTIFAASASLTLLITIFLLSPLLLGTEKDGISWVRFYPEENITEDSYVYNQSIQVAHSHDGTNWIMDNFTILEHFSSPSALIDADGKIRLYASYYHYGYPFHPYTIMGISNHGYVFDWYMTTFLLGENDIVNFRQNEQTVVWNGSVYRTYNTFYFSDEFGKEASSTISTAYSEDGVFFEDQNFAIFGSCGGGLVVDDIRINYPDVVKGDEYWLMFVSKGDKLFTALSNNGVRFIPLNISPLYGIYGSSTVALDRGFRMFYNKKFEDSSSIFSAFSTDGYNWTEEGPALIADENTILHDPSVVRVNDSFWLMYYVAEVNLQ